MNRLFITLSVILLPLSLLADEAKTQPTFAEMAAQLETWQKQHPAKMRLETPGKSVEGRPVFAAVLTDESAPADEKEHVLLTTTHSGIEKGATVAALEIMKWLLSDDDLARAVLRHQVVILMPACNPDGFVKPAFTNVHGHDAYMDWNTNGPMSPQQMPEAAAMQAVMDRWQPEVFSDIHGNDFSFPGYIHFEGHVSNPSLRSYEPEVERLMDEAALAAGFPTHRGESDEQRLYIGPLPGLRAEKLARKKPRYFAGTYCYDHFHSLTLATENAWPQSALARQQRLLQIGNEVWPGEKHAGYPVRSIATHGHSIVAYGNTAAERRASRVELWNKQAQIVQGFTNPQFEGFICHAVATTPAAAAKWLGDGTLKGLRTAIENNPRIDAAAVLAELKNHPDGKGQWGDEAKLSLIKPATSKTTPTAIEHGLAIRLRIPYAKSTLQTVRINGHEWSQDRFETWVARGYRYLQINLPPDQLKTDDVFIITCRYDPGEKREVGRLSP